MREITFPELEVIDDNLTIGFVEYWLDFVFTRGDLPDDEKTADLLLWLIPILKKLRGPAQVGHKLKIRDADHELLRGLAHLPGRVTTEGQFLQARVRKALFTAKEVQEEQPVQTSVPAANGSAAQA